MDRFWRRLRVTLLIVGVWEDSVRKEVVERGGKEKVRGKMVEEKQRIWGVSSVRAVFCVRSMPFDILILTSTCDLAYFSSRFTFSNGTFRRLNYLLSLNALLLAWRVYFRVGG
jgi:hypothetical protein